jgi:hypothetical protein
MKLPFDMFEKVYLLTDPEQRPRLVTGYRITPNEIFVQLSMGTECSEHYHQEITQEKNVEYLMDN